MSSQRHSQRPQGATPLLAAVREGHVGAAEALLAGGADPKARSLDGSDPLYVAAQGASESVRVRGGRGVLGAAAHPPPLCSLRVVAAAAARGAAGDFCELIKLLVAKGADVHAAKKTGATALFIAAQKGRLAAVRLLLLHGASPAVTTSDGASAVLVAAQNGHVEVVGVLVAAGADPKAPWKAGITALFLAAQEGHEAMVRPLSMSPGPRATKPW